MSVKLAYSITGTGKPVVLLHPVGVDRTCWEAVCAKLSGRYKLIAIDLRGHGASPDAAPDTTIKDHADDVAALIRELSIAPAVLVGVSFGGMVAMAIALEYPELVAGLVPAACPATLPQDGRIAVRTRGDKALQGGMETIIDETLERWFSEVFRGNAAFDATRQRLLADKPQNWAATWNAISKLDLLPRLEEIKVPTLAIAGADDRATPLAAMEAIATAIPDGTLVVLEDAPHMLHVEMPEAFSRNLSAFLNERIWPSS